MTDIADIGSCGVELVAGLEGIGVLLGDSPTLSRNMAFDPMSARQSEQRIGFRAEGKGTVCQLLNNTSTC